MAVHPLKPELVAFSKGTSLVMKNLQNDTAEQMETEMKITHCLGV